MQSLEMLLSDWCVIKYWHYKNCLAAVPFPSLQEGSTLRSSARMGLQNCHPTELWKSGRRWRSFLLRIAAMAHLRDISLFFPNAFWVPEHLQNGSNWPYLLPGYRLLKGMKITDCKISLALRHYLRHVVIIWKTKGNRSIWNGSIKVGG